jgi:hypothetical protein
MLGLLRRAPAEGEETGTIISHLHIGVTAVGVVTVLQYQRFNICVAAAYNTGVKVGVW